MTVESDADGGADLRMIRERLGISARALAREMGVTHAVVAVLEQKTRHPQATTVARYRAALQRIDRRQRALRMRDLAQRAAQLATDAAQLATADEEATG